MSYWFCPNCREELLGCHVTYQELCDHCGAPVLSVDEDMSPDRIDEIIQADKEGRLMVLPISGKEGKEE